MDNKGIKDGSVDADTGYDAGENMGGRVARRGVTRETERLPCGELDVFNLCEEPMEKHVPVHKLGKADEAKDNNKNCVYIAG